MNRSQRNRQYLPHGLKSRHTNLRESIVGAVMAAAGPPNTVNDIVTAAPRGCCVCGDTKSAAMFHTGTTLARQHGATFICPRDTRGARADDCAKRALESRRQTARAARLHAPTLGVGPNRAQLTTGPQRNTRPPIACGWVTRTSTKHSQNRARRQRGPVESQQAFAHAFARAFARAFAKACARSFAKAFAQ